MNAIVQFPAKATVRVSNLYKSGVVQFIAERLAGVLLSALIVYGGYRVFLL